MKVKESDAKKKEADAKAKEKTEKDAEQVNKDQEAKKQAMEKSAYSPQEFLRNPTENIAQVLEQHASGQTVDIRTTIRRIEEAYTICGKMYDETFKAQRDSSGNESSLGWAHVAALREAESAPMFHPKQVEEYRAKERAAKKAYEAAQQQTKSLTARRDRLFTMQHETIPAEQQRRDRVMGALGSISGSRDSNIQIACSGNNHVGVLALRELLGISTPDGRVLQRVPFPASAWREHPDGTGPTVAMVLHLVNNEPLTSQELTALQTLAPRTNAVRIFNRRSQIAEFVFSDGQQPALQIKVPASAEVRKRFVNAVEPIIPIMGIQGVTYCFGDALLNPQILDRIATALGESQAPHEVARKEEVQQKEKNSMEERLDPKRLAEMESTINRLVSNQENVQNIVRIDDALAQWNVMNRAQGLGINPPQDLARRERELHSKQYSLKLELDRENDAQMLRWERELKGVTEKLQRQRFAELRTKWQAAQKAEQEASSKVQEWRGNTNRLSGLGKELMEEMNRRDTLAGMRPRGVTADFSSSVQPADERRTREGGLRIPNRDSAETKIAVRELQSLGVTVTAGFITTGPLPPSAWRDASQGNGCSAGMIRTLLGDRPLMPQEESALNTLAPATMSAFRFGRNVRGARLVVADGEPAISLNMDPAHRHFAEVRKRFVDSVQPILRITSESGATFKFGAALMNAQKLDQLTNAIDNGRREVSAEQADREILLLIVDQLPMSQSERKYTRDRFASRPNGVIVEEIIYAFIRTQQTRNFRYRTGLYCDDHGNLRRNPSYNGMNEVGQMVCPHWATTFRASPSTGAAVLAAALGDTAVTSLEAYSNTTRVRALPTEAARNTEVERRRNEIGVGSLFVHVEGSILTRIAAFEAMLRLPDNITFGERLSENYMTLGAASALDLAHLAGLDLSGSIDIRPSSQVRAIRKLTTERLAEVRRLHAEFLALSLSGSPAQQIAQLEGIARSIPGLNLQEFQSRLKLTQQICYGTEVALEYVDMAAETFSVSVPVAGPLLYTSLRNGVGMMAGEQIRNPDGSYRPRDWMDFGISVGTSVIPGQRFVRMIPGVNQISRVGTRWALRYATRHMTASLRRNAIRSFLEESRDRLRDQLRLVAQMSHDGKTWEEIWDRVAAQEPDYVGFIMSCGVRMLAHTGGDAVEKHLGAYLARIGTRMVRTELQALSNAMTKRLSEGASKLLGKSVHHYGEELIKNLAEHEMQEND